MNFGAGPSRFSSSSSSSDDFECYIQDWENELNEMDRNIFQLAQVYTTNNVIMAQCIAKKKRGKHRGSIPGHVVINRGREEVEAASHPSPPSAISTNDLFSTSDLDRRPHLLHQRSQSATSSPPPTILNFSTQVDSTFPEPSSGHASTGTPTSSKLPVRRKRSKS